MFKREAAIKYTGDFLKACKSLPIKIDKAVLFGSVLTGKSNENSDIDLALFSPNFTDNILENLDLIAMVNIRFPDLDIHTYPTIAYSGKGILLDEIKKTSMESNYEGLSAGRDSLQNTDKVKHEISVLVE